MNGGTHGEGISGGALIVHSLGGSLEWVLQGRLGLKALTLQTHSHQSFSYKFHFSGCSVRMFTPGSVIAHLDIFLATNVTSNTVSLLSRDPGPPTPDVLSI